MARDGSLRDYRLVVRAPNPRDSAHVVLVAAGRHSIGAHAAGDTIVRHEPIVALEPCLATAHVSLANMRQPFWAPVGGMVRRRGWFIEDIDIVECRGYERG